MGTPAQTPAPEVTVGLPSGIDSKAVLARKKAMIAAGADPLTCEALAIAAEQEQEKRDAIKDPKPKSAQKGAK